MTATVANRCPVCRRPVKPTRWRYIPLHFDGCGNHCPTDGEPYHITIEGER